MQSRLRRQTQAEGKRADGLETEDGGHVDRVLTHASRDVGEDAGADLTAAVGQRVRPAADQEDEGPQRAVQRVMLIGRREFLTVMVVL